MSSSPVFDKLNLHPKKSKYIFAKSEGGGSNIQALNYSNLIHEQFTNDNTSAFTDRNDGVFPFSSQKYCCNRIITSNSATLSIFAKFPIIKEGTTSTKPYRSAFKGYMYFYNDSNSNNQGGSHDNAVFEIIGRLPSTLEGDNSVTTPTDLTLTNPTNFQLNLITSPINTDFTTYFFYNNMFQGPPYFYVGRDPSSSGMVDNEVDTSSNDFIYIAGIMTVPPPGSTRNIRTIIEYI